MNAAALTLSGIMIFGRTREGDMSIVFLCFGLCLSRSLCFCGLRTKWDESMGMLLDRSGCEAIPHHHKCWVKRKKMSKKKNKLKGLLGQGNRRGIMFRGRAKQRALHFKGSAPDESLDIGKQKEGDGGKIKRTECCQSASCGANKVLSFSPQSYPASWTIAAQFTPLPARELPPSSPLPPPPWQLGVGTFTPRARPATWTPVRPHVHIFPWHVLKREGGENMQRRGEATRDPANVYGSAPWQQWRSEALLLPRPFPRGLRGEGLRAIPWQLGQTSCSTGS